MDGACSTHTRHYKCIQNFGRKPEGRLRHTWEDNSSMDIRGTELGVDWIYVAQDKDQWRLLVNMAMNLRFP